MGGLADFSVSVKTNLNKINQAAICFKSGQSIQCRRLRCLIPAVLW